MNRTFWDGSRLGAVALSLLLAGCGAGPTASDLPVEEVAPVAAAVLFATFDATRAAPPRPHHVDPSATAPVGWTASFEAETRCRAGGVVATAMSVAAIEQPSTGLARLDYTLTQVPMECRLPLADGVDLTVWGRPAISADLAVSHDEVGVVRWRGSARGDVEWRARGEGGRCSFALTFEGEQRGETNARVVGTLCGHSIDRVVTIP